jgi:hypothetical protein
MNVTKMIGMVFLSVYLILTGLSTMSEMTMAPMINKLTQLLGVGAGVLIIISINRFIREKR